MITIPFALIGRMMPSQSPPPPQIELACPSGTSPIAGGQTLNPSTGKFRQYICVDTNGNINLSNAVSPGGNNLQFQYNNNGVFGGTAGITFTGSGIIEMSGGQIGAVASGQKIQFSGTDIVMQTFGGNNIKMNSPLTFSTTTFASIGTVPAAGVGSKFCTDCTPGAICSGAGSGHLAISNGTNWTCQ